ncbi:DUF2164 domain-containing protein [Pseudalkalibacillus salsuginis]|uniref:DUF2164 domain-containing protein n=1 Tax=Pseudalkalibacillus salsuginis TaxID=2910972 RepID=UPI001F40D510|nr:DUF2164 domain-containing protein [Pseudalkalibacillus salsuginis]MCF6411205.1 DUF2164 domain-containing protein [Pseudalkalibacillus salsuginis]
MMGLKIPKEERDQLVKNIQGYFIDERGEEIGDLAAGLMLDFILKDVGPYLYNQGVRDAKKLVQEKMFNVEEDMDALQRPIELHKRY